MTSLPRTQMVNAEDIRSALRCGRSGCPCRIGSNVHCPVHGSGGGDKKPSFTVTASTDRNGNDTVLVHCKTGHSTTCPQDRVIDALKTMGLWSSAPPSPGPTNIKPLEKMVALYDYRNAAGELIAQKARFERPGGDKRFAWRLPNASGWPGLNGITMADLPLWGSELLPQRTGEAVYIVEGEKAAEACRAKGLVALTHPGGASTKTFGQGQLSVLSGRDVRLWPDNDEVGRAFMQRLAAQLRPIVRSVKTVQVAVKEKGDAYDYFGDGGTIEGLDRPDDLSEPAVDHIAADAMTIRLPSSLGTVSFALTEIEWAPRSLDCELEVRVNNGIPYPERINLLSASAKTDLRRALESEYGKDAGWAGIVNRAFALARASYTTKGRVRWYRDIADPGEPVFLADPFIPADAPTVLFGDGSAGKTYITFRLAVSIAAGIPFGDFAITRGRVLVVDYETNEETFRRRVNRLLAGLRSEAAGHLPAEIDDIPIGYFAARGIPLHEQISAIRREVRETGATLVIIDSAAAACGGKPEDAENALKYFSALAKLGDVATLTIAHVPKGGDTDRPLGSVFWANQPRRTWFAERVDNEDSDVIHVGLYCRKVNDGRKPRPVGLRITFEGSTGPVEVALEDIAEIPELDARRNTKARVWDALRTPKSIAQLALELDTKPDTIEKVLRRNKTMFAHLGELRPDDKSALGKWARRLNDTPA